MPAGVYTGGGATVVMDPPPVVYFKLFRFGSEADRYTKSQARQVAILASRLAPRKSGVLARSIRVDQARNERGQYAFGYDVYTAARYGRYVHEGTGPSVRYGTGKKMKFRGTDEYSGQLVYPSVVFHPGTPAQPFLRNALVAMVR